MNQYGRSGCIVLFVGIRLDCDYVKIQSLLISHYFVLNVKKESLINAKEYMIRKINKTQLCKAAGITTNAMAKLGRDETVTQETLEKICAVLGCTLDDIVEIKPDNSNI